MKRTTEGTRAHELESIVAVGSDGFVNRKLYVVDGRPGILFRRVPMSRAGERPGDRVVAWFAGGLVELVAAVAIGAELVEAKIVPERAAVVKASVSAEDFGKLRDAMQNLTLGDIAPVCDELANRGREVVADPLSPEFRKAADVEARTPVTASPQLAFAREKTPKEKAEDDAVISALFAGQAARRETEADRREAQFSLPITPADEMAARTPIITGEVEDMLGNLNGTPQPTPTPEEAATEAATPAAATPRRNRRKRAETT